MRRFASVTFDGVLAASDRDIALRALRSAGALTTSWSDAGDRTFCFVTLAPGSEPIVCPGGRVDEPPLAVFRITPADPARRLALERAVEGAGRPLGIVDARRERDAIVVALQPRVTSLAFFVALVDAALGSTGRAIEPLLPLDDATLTACAGAVLSAPQLDAQCLIETHLAPLLAGAMR